MPMLITADYLYSDSKHGFGIGGGITVLKDRLTLNVGVNDRDASGGLDVDLGKFKVSYAYIRTYRLANYFGSQNLSMRVKF